MTEKAFAVDQPDPVTPPVLLAYQQDYIAARSEPVIVWEKSRRIGASWVAAYEAAETAAASRQAHGDDVLYIGYNLDMAREFIGDAGFWAKALHGFAAEFQEFVFDDSDETGDRSIKAFRIDLASGNSIVALSSRPRSLRGRQGLVIIDEAAFHDDLPGLMKAAIALLMWGGKVRVLSTHEGTDNPFNELVEDCRSGRKPYKLMRTTFDDAIAADLYKRICLVTGKDWSDTGETEWTASIREFYGDDAAEELDVIPSAGSGVWLNRALIDACMTPQYRVVQLKCRDGFELEPDHVREAEVAAWLETEVDPLLAMLDRSAPGFLGGDFARTGDLSVFMPGQLAEDSVTIRVPFIIELRNCPFKQQQQILFYVLDRLPRFMAAAVDARGLGAQIAEAAVQEYGPGRVERVMATAEWYREHMPPLKARFEDRTIMIPRDDDTRQDLRMVKVTRGVPMVPENARARSARGGRRHGDAAIAAAMLQRASTMDILDYGYQAARTINKRVEESRVGDDDDDRGGGARSRFGRTQGAW